MAKVDNPEYRASGEVRCDECPLNDGEVEICTSWWYRNEDEASTILTCPTRETYDEACKFAEKHSTLLKPIAQDS